MVIARASHIDIDQNERVTMGQPPSKEVTMESTNKYQQEFGACRQLRERESSLVARVKSLAVQDTGCSVVMVDNRLSIRALYKAEVLTLQQNGCRGSFQSLRLLLPSEQHRLDQSAVLQERVSQSRFEGTNVLNLDTALESKGLKGVHSNLLIRDCILHLDACVCQNSFISDTFVGPESTLLKCGQVECSKELDFELLLNVGPESGGGRRLILKPEATMMDVCDQLANTLPKKGPKKPKRGMNILCRNSILRDTSTVNGVFLYPSSSIEGASSVQNATLYPTACIRNSIVENVTLQWKSAVVDFSVVSNTIIMENAHAGPKSLVDNSVLGPDVHVSAGEVHASVLGPNTNAHHQSLTISVLWPLGRGNVGYGANVGSNHTGRLPDQETVAGEGLFWGLSTVIKFPVNLASAPYTVVAAGTTLPPQRVTMPFSLIVTGTDGGSNSILPGWVLSSSPYTILRSEQKFAERRKAVHHNHYTGWKIIRPETIDLCLAAMKALEKVETIKPVYKGDRDIPGVGANVISEKGRLAGIKAYKNCIDRFLLHGLLEYLESLENGEQRWTTDEMEKRFRGTMEHSQTMPRQRADEWSPWPWRQDESKLWSYQRSLLEQEFPCKTDRFTWLKSLLQKLMDLENEYAKAVYTSKHRDDVRGAATIPGYKQSHVSAAQDGVIHSARASAQETESKVKQVLGRLDRLTSKL